VGYPVSPAPAGVSTLGLLIILRADRQYAPDPKLVEYSVPDFTKLAELDLGDPPARVVYDPTENRYVVTFRDLDLVRVYERNE
jgi:hypothetical protein